MRPLGGPHDRGQAPVTPPTGGQDDRFLDSDTPVGFSCRLYRTDAGLAGSPMVDQLVAVLRAANG